MDPDLTRKWLRYWRNTLADASSSQGAISEGDLNKYLSTKVPFEDGYIGDDSRLLKALFDGEKEETELVHVLYRPLIYRCRKEHLQKKLACFPDIISPITCQVLINREGYLFPASPPLIPRDLLQPSDDDSFTLSHIDELDTYLNINKVPTAADKSSDASGGDEPIQNWQDYYEYCCTLIDAFELNNKLEVNYDKLDTVCFFRYEKSDTAFHLLKLYDWLTERAPDTPLLDTYAQTVRESYEKCLDSNQYLSIRSAHSNAKFPLAKAQRDALTHVLGMESGEVLAVNGPPGTGKTTFVLSVVASMWVNAALEETEPPLIIAASTNNQAVTNILDAFAKDFGTSDDVWTGRWLPDIDSYGGYYPSKSRMNEAVQKGYQTRSFYQQIEDPSKYDAIESFFIEQAKQALDEHMLNDLESIKNELVKHLKFQHSQIKAVFDAWSELVSSISVCQEEIGDPPEQFFEQKKTKIQRINSENEHIVQTLKEWKRFCAKESIWLNLFSFLPPVKRKRDLLRECFIEEEFSEQAKAIMDETLNPDVSLTEWIKLQKRELYIEEASLNKWKTYLDDLNKNKERWGQLASKLSLDSTNISSFESLDEALDIHLRFQLFQIAVHYWEARWLLDCRKQSQELTKQSEKGTEKPGMKSVLPRWRRRMKLTPCIVSTLHSLPSHMTYSKFEDEGQFSQQYLINEIDLLILDEAGQISPEIAGPSMALAKKALVIGDVHQIKPIPQQIPSVDIGNLRQQNILTISDEYDTLREKGRTVVAGSVMRIAQTTSRYRYLSKKEPGMYLREHRRCLNEIISFCNELCYEGAILPMRGMYKDARPRPYLPPLNYLHVDGFCSVSASGSRINKEEADTIARWLSEYRDDLEKHYGKPLKDIVAIVTPFRAQSMLISKSCLARNIDSGITIGTVHALQGAEKPVVLFSGVYTRHADGSFIDQSSDMLNVAVSRAKDSFILIGDMDVFAAASNTAPRHLLYQRIIQSENSEISFAISERYDLLLACKDKPLLLNGSEEHDEYFGRLLKSAQYNVGIVSPWISLSRLEESGLLAHMMEAVSRGIKVTLYTDKRFNCWEGKTFSQEKEQLFTACCESLMNKGMIVKVVERVHSKLILVDDNLVCVGSYNWASAAREGVYRNVETSMLYSGSLKGEIRLQIDLLENLVDKIYKLEDKTT